MLTQKAIFLVKPEKIIRNFAKSSLTTKVATHGYLSRLSSPASASAFGSVSPQMATTMARTLHHSSQTSFNVPFESSRSSSSMSSRVVYQGVRSYGIHSSSSSTSLSPSSVVYQGTRSYVTHSSYDPLDIPTDLDLFSFLAERLDSFKDKTYNIDGITGQVTTHGQFREEAAAVGSALVKRGLGIGDVVCIFALNSVEYMVTMLGCFGVGAVASPANSTFNAEELKRQMAATSAKFLITSVDLLEIAKSAVSGDPQLQHVEIVVIGLPPSSSSVSTGVTPFQVLIEDKGDAFPSAAARRQIICDPSTHVALLPFSSGTTGLPKGVQQTHLNLIANMVQVSTHEEILGPTSDGSRDRALGLLPMWHISQTFASLVFLRLGTMMVTLPKFEPVSFLESIANHKLGFLVLVPPLVLFLNKHPMVKGYDLSNAKDIVCGAAPLNKNLQEDVAKQLGITRFRQLYGMTETTLATVGLSTEWSPGSVGVPIPNTSIKIIPAEEGREGEDLSVGETGEIIIKGPQVMLGYMNNQKATEQIISADGWLHTGDIGSVKNGCLTVVDRVKELIKYKGHQVAPAELEALLLHHPSVADAAVTGIPDDVGGEVPRAFIVLKPGIDNGNAMEEDVKYFVDSQVNPLSKLRGGIEVIDAIPKAASGKILRRELKSRFIERK